MYGHTVIKAILNRTEVYSQLSNTHTYFGCRTGVTTIIQAYFPWSVVTCKLLALLCSRHNGAQAP